MNRNILTKSCDAVAEMIRATVLILQLMAVASEKKWKNEMMFHRLSRKIYRHCAIYDSDVIIGEPIRNALVENQSIAG